MGLDAGGIAACAEAGATLGAREDAGATPRLHENRRGTKHVPPGLHEDPGGGDAAGKAGATVGAGGTGEDAGATPRPHEDRRGAKPAPLGPYEDPGCGDAAGGAGKRAVPGPHEDRSAELVLPGLHEDPGSDEAELARRCTGGPMEQYCASLLWTP